MHYLRIHLYCVLLQPGSDCPEAEDIDNGMIRYSVSTRVYNRGRILVQVTIYRRLLIGRDGNLDQSEAYDIS